MYEAALRSIDLDFSTGGLEDWIRCRRRRRAHALRARKLGAVATAVERACWHCHCWWATSCATRSHEPVRPSISGASVVPYSAGLASGCPGGCHASKPQLAPGAKLGLSVFDRALDRAGWARSRRCLVQIVFPTRHLGATVHDRGAARAVNRPRPAAWLAGEQQLNRIIGRSRQCERYPVLAASRAMRVLAVVRVAPSFHCMHGARGLRRCRAEPPRSRGARAAPPNSTSEHRTIYMAKHLIALSHDCMRHACRARPRFGCGVGRNTDGMRLSR